MSYKELRDLAIQTMNRKYCVPFNGGSMIPSWNCSSCPLHVIEDDLDSLCVTGLYEKIFIDGYEQKENQDKIAVKELKQ